MTSHLPSPAPVTSWRPPSGPLTWNQIQNGINWQWGRKEGGREGKEEMIDGLGAPIGLRIDDVITRTSPGTSASPAKKKRKKKEKKRKLNWIGNETTKRWWTGQDVHVCWGGVNAYRVELIKSRNNFLGILCVRWWAARRRRIVFGRMLIVMTSLYPNLQSPPHRYLRWESWGID